MARVGPLVAVLALMAAVSGASVPSRLPPLEFEDQEGRRLAFRSLRGGVAVIVYGGRDAMDDSITWGTRLDAELRAQGAYTLDTPDAARPVRILALAQMGGIPDAFRGLLRGALKQRTPAGFSLWLDWEDRLATIFGAHRTLPTVVVADRESDVRLVTTGRPEGAAWDTVADLVRHLR